MRTFHAIPPCALIYDLSMMIFPGIMSLIRIISLPATNIHDICYEPLNFFKDEIVLPYLFFLFFSS